MHWLPVLPGLGPGWIKLALLDIAWLWFINLFNFMDGIDGISGVALIGIGLGATAVMLLRAPTAATSALEGAVGVSDLMLAAAVAGFLTANRAPARVFPGDVGSIPLGFLAGARRTCGRCDDPAGLSCHRCQHHPCQADRVP
jgi:UDP-N-acetylmuramyl pentapeptide phosphotransferase/UDP-N-acetylglucosamine-1-phosphate transferase